MQSEALFKLEGAYRQKKLFETKSKKNLNIRGAKCQSLFIILIRDSNSTGNPSRWIGFYKTYRVLDSGQDLDFCGTKLFQIRHDRIVWDQDS